MNQKAVRSQKTPGTISGLLGISTMCRSILLIRTIGIASAGRSYISSRAKQLVDFQYQDYKDQTIRFIKNRLIDNYMISLFKSASVTRNLELFVLNCFDKPVWENIHILLYKILKCGIQYVSSGPIVL